MDWPKIIHDFVLHRTHEQWVYKGTPLESAHYIKLGSRVDIFINAIASKDGKLSYEIQLKHNFIRDIPSKEEAIQIIEEVIEENKLFIED